MEEVKTPMANFDELFASISNIRVAVVGDVMLDTYWWGNVERISPEGPVPVVALNKKEYRIGGAGNVALNTISMGAETTLFSVVGEDEDAETLLSLLQEEHIDTKYILRSNERITTNKIRIIGRNQQMMRIDSEVTNDISDDEEIKLLNNFTSYVRRYQPSVVIFEDYNKGVLTESLIKAIIAVCREHNIATAVDPKRKNFFAYEGVNIFKPNLKEVREALNMLTTDVSEELLKHIHHQLYDRLHHKISLITLSEHGLFFQKGNYAKVIPTHIRNIADVSGAGDTVIAVVAVMYAVTRDITIAAEVANVAGGIVCEGVGTIAINRQLLLADCQSLLCG